MNSPQGMIVIGRITTVFGVRGWVKIYAHTDQPEAVFDYQPWLIKDAGGYKPLVVKQWRPQGKALVAHIEGIDDRDVAREQLCQRDIYVSADQLPVLPEGEYYWSQLIGLSVLAHSDNRELRLGVVSSMLETGANDVLVVSADADSIDDRERLIPWVDQFLRRVDLQAGTLEVDWDPEF